MDLSQKFLLSMPNTLELTAQEKVDNCKSY